MAKPPARHRAILSIDQGTTNTKAALVSPDGQLLSGVAAPLGVTTPRPGWVEQDASRLWDSVTAAVAGCMAGAGDLEIAAITLSTQRESVVGWRATTGRPVGPVIGWQDRRTAAWCAKSLDGEARQKVQAWTGLRVDAMFSAPKIRWLLDSLPEDVPLDDVRVGTVESWLIWNFTGGTRHLSEAGNASRTLLYDLRTRSWSPALLDIFDVPAVVLPDVLHSDSRFGATRGVPGLPDGVPIVAVLADSHAALFGHGCTEVGMAKATYGTGSSVMTPITEPRQQNSSVPTTLAWIVNGLPTFALEGNVLSSGATLAWAANLLTAGRVPDLVELAETVPDSGGVTLIPAFTGLGAPHWDRNAQAVISGMSPGTTGAHIARAAIDAVAHQICDIVDVIEQASAPLTVFRADGGATASALVVQTQADLLGRDVEVGDVAEVSALGAAKLGWQALGHASSWPEPTRHRVFASALGPADRRRRRAHWSGEIARARLPSAGSAAND